MGLVPSFKFSNRRANMEMQAGAFAQSSLERLRSLPFQDLVSAQDTVQKDDMIFTRNIEVTDSPSGFSKTTRVEVSWIWQDRTFSAFRETIITRVPRS